MHIYVLALSCDKYYVGKTTDIDFRIETHMQNHGSAFTKKYPPIELVNLIETNDEYDETKYTLKYMEIYGIENVRGASFCNINLSREEYALINKMILGSTDKCYTCGQGGHFAADCATIRAPVPIFMRKIQKSYDSSYDSSYTNSRYNNQTNFKERPKRRPKGCFRCGHESHYAEDCYATTHVKGYKLKY
jgi:hypothetical protein